MQHTLPMLYYCSVFYFRHEICFLIIFLSRYVIGLEQCHPHIFRHVRLALLIVTLITWILNFCIWNCFLAWIVIFSLNSVSSHSTSMHVYEEEGYLERMCVCSCVCVCLPVCTRVHVCMYVSPCVCMHVHLCACMCAYLCVSVCVHICMHMCVSVCLCMFVCALMHVLCVCMCICVSVCVSVNMCMYAVSFCITCECSDAAQL